MSISNIFKPGGLVWRPDANAINAPDGTLLRCDNMVPDEDGALSVRRGSRELYDFPLGTEDVSSLYTYEGSDGNTYRLMQADDQANKNPGAGNHTAHWEIRIGEAQSFTMYTQFNYTGGYWEKAYASAGDVGPVPFTAEWEGPTGDNYIAGLVTNLEPVNYNLTFTGTGDLAWGDDHQQSFFARGTTAKKFDGKSFLNWGIAKPSSAPTVSAVTPQSGSAISCATGESNPPAVFVGYEPTVASFPTTDVEASGSFVTDSAGNANQATQLTTGKMGTLFWGSITKTWNSDQDFYNIGTVVGTDDDIFDISVNIAAPDEVDRIEMRLGDGALTYYTWSFDPNTGQATAVRDVEAEGASAYGAKVSTSLDPVDPKDKPRVNTPEEVQNTVSSVTGDTSSETTNSATPPPGEWFHVSWTRGQFAREGTSTDVDLWEKIRQADIVVWAKSGKYPVVSFADFIVYSSGTGTLTGTYRAVVRFIRETDRYYELSPPSAESSDVILFANQLKVTVPGAVQNAADDQVTTVWVYIFGGYLDTYYRAATATLDPQLSTDLEVLIEVNEIQILTENEKLEPYTDEPRDNIIAIAGPWNGRLFTLTSEGYVYPSLQTTPNLFNTYQVIDLSNQGDPLWMVKTSSGIHVGSEKDVVFLAGSGDEDADRVVIDLYPHPLNIGTPPFDKSVFVEGNSILYRSTDGLIMLASQGLAHIPDDGIRLLWRGQDRHGVSALNTTTGRFRMTVDGKIMYLLAPEGATTSGTTVVYRLDMGKGQWSRLVYPNGLLSIITEPDGTLLAGTNDGHVLELEYGTGDDNAVKPTVQLLTPFMSGDNPLVRKDSFDLQFHTDTNGNTATAYLYKDGATTETTSYTFSTAIPQAYRIQAEDFGTFIKAQLKITGTFDEFQLSSFDLTYRVRPQHMTYLDTGYIIGDDPADVVWLQEVEVDVNSPSDLSVLVYLDDRLYATETVTASANVRTVYRVPLPRGTKSRRPRIVVKTSASDGAGEVGFDPYFVRVRTRNSGNESGGRFRTVWPAGNAP